MTDSDLKRYNRLLAEELGRAPHGWPLYKWVRPRELFYLIEHAVDDLTPAGLHVIRNGYKAVSWEQHIGPGWPWMIATWQDPGTLQEWYAKYQDIIPYPPQGMYYPIDGSQIPCDPTIEITSEVIRKVRGQLSESFETHLARIVAEHELRDEEAKAQSDERIDSDWPAFNCEVVVPGHELARDN